MKLKSSVLLIFLYSLLFFSMYLVLVSENLLVTWLGLELNVFSTLPILIISSKFSFLRAKMHVFLYFLFQTVGSLLLIAGFCLSSTNFVLIGLLMKLGIFPLKFWVPLVFSSMEWMPLFILLVLKKVPLMYLFSFFNVGVEMWALCLLTVFFSIIALYFSLSKVKLFVCWSSVINTGFMCIVFSTKVSLGVGYFFLYCVVMFFVSYFFHFSKVDFVSSKSVNLSLKNQVCFASGNFVLLILAGLPMFFSWFMKILLMKSFSAYMPMPTEFITVFFSKTYFLIFVLNFLVILKICAYLKFFINNMLFVFSVSKNLSKLLMNTMLYFLFVYIVLLYFVF